MNRPKPLILIILDGWGYAPPSNSNAISLARKPTYDKLLCEFPNTLVHTSGRFVGLPTGQMGNSEVGHLNIGAGRVVYMDITKIDLMIENGELFTNPLLLDAMKHAKADGRRLHFSDCFLTAASTRTRIISTRCSRWRSRTAWNAHSSTLSWMDATRCPTSGAGYIEQLQQKARELDGVGRVASVSGRYYAMDRDKKWDRERLAFDAMVHGKAQGGTFADPVQGDQGVLQQRRDRRVHHSVRLRR